MAAWSDGYFTEVQYTGHYFGYMAPSALNFACLRRGVRPPALRPGATYMELGCGQGFGLNLMAAANPHLNFVGIDFNPSQVANARALAAEAGLANVAFEDLSFEQVLTLPDGRLPKCDVIALHGVISWISPENRARTIRIIDRHLQPGGLAVLSYNTYPGWAAILPLQRFVKAYVARAGGDPTAEIMSALGAAQEMLEAGGGVFARTPQIKSAIERMLKQSPAYLLHELVHDHFHPLFHADVARELEAARMTYVAQGQSIDDSPDLAVPPAHRPRVLAASDPVWRETLIDYASDRLFRRDIFVRGLNALTAGERADRLEALRFAMIKPATRISFEFKVPLGKLTGDPATYGAIVGALGDGPKRYDELASLAPIAGNDARLLKALGLLMDSRAIHPLVEDVDPAPAQAFNRVLLDRFRRDGPPDHLAAPQLGAGVAVRFDELLGLAAPTGRKADVSAAAQLGWQILTRTGRRLQRDGRTLTDQAETEADLAQRLAAFAAEERAVLAGLGVI